MEETGCEIICGAPTTLAVRGLMMMIMMMVMNLRNISAIVSLACICGKCRGLLFHNLPKLNTSHRNEVLSQDTTHLIQRPCYRGGGPCQDPAGNRTTRRLLTIVKRRKQQWYGHVSRPSGLAQTLLQGTVKGGRRQCRQGKRWEDNIGEWTSLEFGKSQRAVENKEKLRKLVAESYVVPQRPPRIGDDNDDESTETKENRMLNGEPVCCMPSLVLITASKTKICSKYFSKDYF